jgi:signal transduction histidine kinase
MTLLASSSETLAQPTALLQVTQIIDFVVLATATVVLGRQLRTRNTMATRWALAMFGLFTLVVSSGFLGITKDDSTATHLFSLALISLLLLIPYTLVRFAGALKVLGRRAIQVAGVLTVAQILATLTLPKLPEPGAARPAYFTVYVILIVTGWTVQSVMSAIALWRAGNGQPSVVRHRMRVLSLGSIVIVVSLLSSAGSSQPSEDAQVISTLIGVAGVLMTVLSFVVPNWLRAAWRAADLVELGKAERRLMTAVTEADVAGAIVPAIIKLFGAKGAALLHEDGRALESQGLSEQALESLRDAVRTGAADGFVDVLANGGFTCRLSQGWIVLEAGVFAPLFGAAELSMLDRVGSFVDLALQRCRLFEQEAASRHAAEAANAELQTLVYSVSHDLRNPIISVLGYLDVLQQEHVGQLQGEGPHYLDRIQVNALYMQSLIQDLLELSRIGRSEPASQAVEVAALAESVAQEVRVMHPGCKITVSGSFPVLWMSELRARQLLTNLMDNAAKHGSAQPHVRVRAVAREDGGATLLISDDGKGVPEQYREKAFDVFERLEAARSDIPGTGMGLPICKRIVESLHGIITLEGPTDSPAGATVRITLPRDVVRRWSDVTQPAKENAR